MTITMRTAARGASPSTLRYTINHWASSGGTSNPALKPTHAHTVNFVDGRTTTRANHGTQADKLHQGSTSSIADRRDHQRDFKSAHFSIPDVVVRVFNSFLLGRVAHDSSNTRVWRTGCAHGATSQQRYRCRGPLAPSSSPLLSPWHTATRGARTITADAARFPRTFEAITDARRRGR